MLPKVWTLIDNLFNTTYLVMNSKPYQFGTAPGDLEPQRGTLILVLSILSGIVRLIHRHNRLDYGQGRPHKDSWRHHGPEGNTDLPQIEAGMMDPSGKGTTNAGRICGIIGTIVAIIGCGAQLLIIAAEFSQM